ncbi:hypothetical protein DOY81_004152 [Sarcophaga bullata]|nr:hypothetical protein DOY81_004152 [Sarcophaga bullata]
MSSANRISSSGSSSRRILCKFITPKPVEKKENISLCTAIRLPSCSTLISQQQILHFHGVML